MQEHRAEDLSKALRTLNMPINNKELYDAYYIERESPVNEIKTLFEHSDQSDKVLFTGHRAVGKTTELYRLSFQLDNFNPIFLSMIIELKTIDLQYTDIPVLIFLKILQKVTNDKNKDNVNYELDEDTINNTLRQLEEISGERITTIVNEKSKEKGLGMKLSIWVAELFGSYTREETIRSEVRKKTTGLIKDLYEQLKTIVDQMKKKKEPILIIDDLEKFPLEPVENIFYKYSQILSEPECKIIYTFPIALKTSKNWNNISRNFAGDYSLTAIPVKDRDDNIVEKNIKFFEQLTYKRVSEDLIESDALRKLALYSGGLPSEFQRLAVNACLNALNNRRKKIVVDDADYALYKMVDETYSYAVREENYERLKSIHKSKNTVDDELLGLMHNLLVIEYRMNRDRWYDLHPAVKQHLREKGLIEDK